jgi:hypothetical protein
LHDSEPAVSQSVRIKIGADGTPHRNDRILATPMPGRGRPPENDCLGITSFPAAGSSHCPAAVAGKATRREKVAQAGGYSYLLSISGCLSLSGEQIGRSSGKVRWLNR